MTQNTIKIVQPLCSINCFNTWQLLVMLLLDVNILINSVSFNCYLTGLHRQKFPGTFNNYQQHNVPI